MKPSRVAALLALLLLLASGPCLAAASNGREPFLAVYLNFADLFDLKTSSEQQTNAIAAALDRMKSCGFNTLLPYVTTTSGEAAYPSRLMPTLLVSKSDPMAALMRAARERGLRVHPVQCALSAGGLRPGGILRQHPEWALRDVEGHPLGTISPANPEARAWVASVSREIVARYQPDGLLLDYLRFPNQPVQLDPAAAKNSPAPAPKASREDKARFQVVRVEALTEQARLISDAARSAKHGLRIAIYSWGPHVVKNHNVSQNWPLWAARGYIDNVNLSGYCFPESYGEKYLAVFEQRLTDAQKFNAPVELSFALGIKTSHGGIKQAADVKGYLDIARRLGIRGTAVFTWGHLQSFRTDFERGSYLREFGR